MSEIERALRVDAGIRAGISTAAALQIERARAGSALREIYLLAGEAALDAVIIALRREAVVGHPPIVGDLTP
jgi:hypothetical protein